MSGRREEEGGELRNHQRLFVVGASAGGVQALQGLAAALPADFAAPLLVVLHVGSHPSILPELLRAAGPLPARHAVQGQGLQKGCITVAPPDHHMLVIGDRIELTRGPKEHHARPAIDPLFLSAALSQGPGVVGVILTGMLDDGTAGLQAVKQAGGAAVVQNPDDALAPSMPLSALKHVEVDHCVSLAQLPKLLCSLATRPVTGGPNRPLPALQHELSITLTTGNAMEHLHALGATPSTFVCPDCHGDLWEIGHSRPPRYRCHTGHAFTLRTLQHALSTATDDAVWNALRALQEKALVQQRMARLHREAGETELAEQMELAAKAADEQAAVLRNLVEHIPEPVE
ncbi:MAG: chemotaxis protein CheB [Pseudomonadota bacterium]